jgi:localization factor PodJL
MNSRVSWSLEGIDPSVRERAEAAARRAGMSLNDWLNSSVGDSTPPGVRGSDRGPTMPAQESADVADIHQRLDSITRQIEQISRPATRHDAPRTEQAVARQLNDAILRLDARLSQITNPTPALQIQDQQRQTDMVERAAAQVYRSSPPLSPVSLQSAIAEIAARQSELDGLAPPPARSIPPVSPVTPPVMSPGPDFSILERHLFKITSQIEALQRPDGVEQSIVAFRGELTEIRQAITEAMPRRAIESLENEIRSLSRRIDDTRQSGTDGEALAGIERALGEIRQVLRTLTPAEQLAGYDEAIRNLGAKLDLILRANDDPSTVQQLEGAIAALRAIVSNVASNDALARLSSDVHTLSSKVDQLARSAGNTDSFAVLEQRISALSSKLETRPGQGSAENSVHLENALRALSDRIDRMPVGNDTASAFAHLEQRVSYLLERLEASADQRGAVGLGRVEDGLQDILRHLETQQATFTALAENKHGPAAPADPGLIDAVKRELSDIRFSQAQTDRHTQDSLETVHNTLGHVVDRLAMIEGDLRTVRSTPVAAPDRASPPQEPAAPRIALGPQARPELPNPAAAQSQFSAAPREFQAAPPVMPAAGLVTPQAITEILEPHAAQVQEAARRAVEPALPPDHPLEPGTRPTGRMASPSERIAMSERAISEIAVGSTEKTSTSSFIAAARRAAQAAAAAAPADKARPLKIGAGDKAGSTITSKIRAVLVAASVVVIVLGSFKMAMTLLDDGSAPQTAVENSSSVPPFAQPPADADGAPGPSGPDAPSLTSPSPVGRQSRNTPGQIPADTAPSAPTSQTTMEPATAPRPAGDITGSLPIPQTSSSDRRLGLVQVPPTETLPEGIGGTLRAAALKGDPTAAYELGLRFTEGKGIAPNLDEAAKWYDRAAQAGVVPAIFRLGTFYEKGLSVKKDADIARRYYLLAAERGSAKAMHNLAVLDADGGGKGANYKNASQWFRKAADRGVADSQFNLGILYARGIGVEQNLAESFKWFSLAAAQGDADATRKRDDIANRLDPQSLAAAKLAIQTFTPEPQPDDAINVATPPGGWDSAPAQGNSAKPAKTASIKRAAR